MTKFESDSEIVARILNGEREYYRALVDKYSLMVFHVVRSFEKNEEEVKGIAQEIFVKAYTKLDSFANRSKFSTWIYSLALNHCKDYAKNIRRKNKRFSELEESFIDQEKSTDLQPDESIERRETKQALLDAIGKLSPDQSEPLLMKYRDGMSYQAISEILNISEPALKVRVHRARAELKQLLEHQTTL